ncbi:MAG: tRNA 2-selenouridine(34) synthase MnmH [Planctomycetota bacterium]|nr:tRNA 2-selenouridine(34) synthase MnmH [Planctomycetota bacterium]
MLDSSAIIQPVPMVQPEQVLGRRDVRVIDLRSPSEYAEDHLPGAVNVPLFGDLQRSMVGFLYQQSSPEAAFDQGRTFAMQGVQEMVQSIGQAAEWQIPQGDFAGHIDRICSVGMEALEQGLEPHGLSDCPPGSVVLHCWRGGLRSRSVVSLLRGLGLDRAVGLNGGYKGYRRAVLDGLSAWKGPKPIVLRGLTGVGKTLVLRELERQRPGWTLDLEGLAGHRSSLLGMVGLKPCSQKTFDTRLFGALSEGLSQILVVEGESRKVGDVILPKPLWEAMAGGDNLWLEASEDYRVQVLMEDYLGKGGDREALRRQLVALAPRLPGDLDLVGLFDRREEPELVRRLLYHHYDPLYLHSEGDRRTLATFDTSNVEAAAAKIAGWIEARL